MPVCSSAKVQVYLRNEGPDGFEPDKFPDEVIVERAISRSGPSTVKLMDKHQNVVYNVCVVWEGIGEGQYNVCVVVVVVGGGGCGPVQRMRGIWRRVCPGGGVGDD